MATSLARFVREHTLLSIFVVGYTLGFTGWAVLGGNGEFIFYAAVMVVLIAAVLYVHGRVRFSTLVLWGLGAWGLLHMAGGNVPIPLSLALDLQAAGLDPGQTRTVLYNLRPVTWVPKFDQWVHAFGFFVATLATFEALRAAVGRPARMGTGLIIAAALGGLGLSALNEVVEFAATRFMDTNVGGYVNTGWDLVSNLVGCALAALLLAARQPSGAADARWGRESAST